jgi:acetolactate synthase-1/2/3 large subunit
MENHYLGMVRQWQELFFDNRLSGVNLDGNPDFVKFAECFAGAKGFRIRRKADVDRVIKKAFDYNDGPCLIVAEVEKQDNVFPMIPAGKGYDDRLLERPAAPKEK